MKVFISYAHSDGADLAKPLADGLKARGVDVWFDEFKLKPGDNNRVAIDKGILNQGRENGVVIFTHGYFQRKWTQWELDGLVQLFLSPDSKSKIIPIWHNIPYNDMKNYSPPLANIVAIISKQYTINEICSLIIENLS